MLSVHESEEFSASGGDNGAGHRVLVSGTCGIKYQKVLTKVRERSLQKFGKARFENHLSIDCSLNDFCTFVNVKKRIYQL